MTKTLEEQEKMFSLFRKNFSCREIAREMGIHPSTVSRYIKKRFSGEIERRGLNKPKIYPRLGRSILSLIRNNKRVSLRQLSALCAKHHQIAVSYTTIRKFLRVNSMTKKKVVYSSMINSRTAAIRLAWCRKYENWTLEQWRRVIFSDETYLRRHSKDGRVQVWVDTRKPLDKQGHQIETSRASNYSLMVWGSMCGYGRGNLVWHSSSITADSYLQILKEDLKDTVNDLRKNYDLRSKDIVFQHDNAPAHTAGRVKDYLDNQPFKTLSWPPYSPDLNPIENVWSLLKLEVRKLNPEPKSEKDLWESVQTVWNRFGYEYFRKLVDSMPRRLQRCIINKGYHTRH